MKATLRTRSARAPWSRAVAAALALLALPGGAPAGASVLATAASLDARAPLPERLSETGLYADPATLRVADDALVFEPQYPLWSDGAAKRRWIRLPEGAHIDASDPDRWAFPVGTRLWKEFGFDRRVETRLMELVAPDRWRYAAYVWDAEERDATLAPERGLRGAWRHADGTPYDVPARADCAICHEAGEARVLGFGALQLSPDRDPLAPHAREPRDGAVDLAELVARGLLVGLPRELLERAPRVPARTPRERAALGYLHANCGSCHAAAGQLASLGLALDAPVQGAPGALATSLGVASRYRPAGAIDAPLRIAPGDPAASVLVQRALSRDPLVQMPPLGTHVADREALELIQAWIREELVPAPVNGPTHDPSQPRS